MSHSLEYLSNLRSSESSQHFNSLLIINDNNSCTLLNTTLFTMKAMLLHLIMPHMLLFNTLCSSLKWHLAPHSVLLLDLVLITLYLKFLRVFSQERETQNRTHMYIYLLQLLITFLRVSRLQAHRYHEKMRSDFM